MKENIEKEIAKNFEKKEKIIEHNNTCILEATIFYENIFLFYIIKKIFLNENFEKNKKMYKFICERMTFSDRYEIIKEFVKNNNIKTISNTDFEFFIKIRNIIAHRITGIREYNINNRETVVSFGEELINWKEYVEKIKKWAEISYKIAEFSENVYHFVNDSKNDSIIFFKYYKYNKDCVLMKHELVLQEPGGTCIDTGKQID